MELRHLRVFIAVAEEQHFGRAGIRLQLSQPAISGQIRQLEAELGVRLLQRSARHVALTEAGGAFLEDARRIVTRVDAATTRVRSWRQGSEMRIRIGYVDDGFPPVLPIALRRLAAAGAPHVELTRGQPEDLIAQVRDNCLDVAIVALPAAVSGLRVEEFAYEDAAVAVSTGLFDGREDKLPLEILPRGAVLARPRRTNPGFFDAVLAAFSTAGIPSPILEVEGVSIEQLLLQVAAGADMALVPHSVADRLRIPGVGLRRLSHGSPIGCQLATVCADRTPRAAVEMFFDALKQSAGPSPTRVLYAMT
jgi:DNA-binding transcriptional LysR family regulator